MPPTPSAPTAAPAAAPTAASAIAASTIAASAVAAPVLRLEPAPRSLPTSSDDGSSSAHSDRRRWSGRDAEVWTGRAVQGALALTFPLPSGAPEVPTPPPGLRVVGGDGASRGGRDSRPDGRPGHLRLVSPITAEDEYESTGSADLPDPRTWAGQLVQGLLEVIGGDRPVAQLSRWLGHEVYVELQRRVRSSARTCPPHLRQARRGVVRSLHLCEPSDGVVEVAAMVAGAGRAAAVALRLEGRDGRWLCTALELG